MRYTFFFLILFITMPSFAQKMSSSVGFIENKGQIIDQKGAANTSVLYLLNTDGLNVQLKKNGFSYDVYETKKHKLSKKERQTLYPGAFPNSTETQPDHSLEYIYHRIDIDFVNSNADVKLVSEEKSVDYDNYYNVVHAPNGITNVHKYQKVTYKNIYDNIDIAFFIPKDSTKAVEYNFIVKPGGKISDIQLKFSGAKTELADNKIKMQVRFGEMEETLPLSWIENGAGRKEIAVGYKKIKKGIYGFEGNVNSSDKTIVIDPVPVRLWGTYYGGSSLDLDASSINTDTHDNVILSGKTYSDDNIATTGAFVISNINHSSVSFLVKFNSQGQRIWGTYITNGDLDTLINDAKINSSNEIYIVGKTWDGGSGVNLLATSGSHKPNPSVLSSEGFIIKFDENGIRLWGTFFGGNNSDEIKTILLDENQNIVIAGMTSSPTGISTTNGFLNSYPLASTFNPVGFISRFSPLGNQLYGSYYYVPIEKCIKDTTNNLYFSGEYYNNVDYPNISTVGSHQSQYSGIADLYLTKFDSQFNLLWCTYYGGFHEESTSNIGADGNNNIYLTGTTQSAENIATPGSHKENNPGGFQNAFVVKFSSNGQIIWGTYFGGISAYNNDGFVKQNGDVFLAGKTMIPDFSTPNSFQPQSNGSEEGYFTKFDTNGNLLWSSYYGTPSQDDCQRVYFSGNNLYIAGYSSGIATNGNNLGTPGTHMPNGGGYLCFLAKLQDCLSSPQVAGNNPCIGSSIQLSASGGTNYSWTGPNNFSSTDPNPIILNANTTHSGVYSCAITGTGGCDGTSTVTVTVGNTSPPVPTVATLPNITGDCSTSVTPPTATTACSGVVTATTANPLTYNVPGTYTIVWNYIDGNGNTATQNQSVIINSQPIPNVTSPQTFCLPDNATLNHIAITGQNIKWYDDLTGGNLLPNATLLQNNTTYYVSQTIGGCESDRIPVLINIQNTPAPIGSISQSFCASLNPTLNNMVVTGTNLTWYDSVTGGSVLPISTLLVNGATYYGSQTINNCDSTVRLAVSVSLTNTLPATNYTETLCDALNDGSETVDLANYNSNLIANPSDYSFTYYTTFNGAENELISDQITTIANYPLNIGVNNVFVRIVSSTTCYKVVELKWTLIASPFVNMENSYSLCQNNSIAITAGPAAGFSYLWSTLATTPTIVVNQPGNYWVTVSKNHNPLICSTRKDFTVVASNSATITNIVTADWTNDENTITVLLSDSSIGNYEYSIDGIHYQDSNVFYGLISGVYTVFVKDKNDCGEVSQDLYLLMYPNFFTPNGDGYNDFWKIKFSYFEPGLKVKIMDRYGKIIKELLNNQYWDGTYNGKELPSTDYWFIVTRANGKEHRGHFTLKR